MCIAKKKKHTPNHLVVSHFCAESKYSTLRDNCIVTNTLNVNRKKKESRHGVSCDGLTNETFRLQEFSQEPFGELE